MALGHDVAARLIQEIRKTDISCCAQACRSNHGGECQCRAIDLTDDGRCANFDTTPWPKVRLISED
jgi:hypothetical protein